MDYYVYAIKSLVKSYIYVGLTSSIEKRLNQHNKGQNRSTKAYRPLGSFIQKLLKQE